MPTDKYRRISPMSRRRFMLDTATIGSATLLSGGSAREVFAQDRKTTMVIAAPATPQSLDCNFDVSLGTFEAIAALYDGLLGFEKIPDQGAPDARREDIAFHSRQPGQWWQARRKLGARPGRKARRFKLRQGVKSNWGNELTAEDVKWTWDRKLELGALGALPDRLGLKADDRSRSRANTWFRSTSRNPTRCCSSSTQPLQPDLRRDEMQGGRRAATIRGRASSSRTNRPASAHTRLQPDRARPAGRLQGARRLLGRQAGHEHGDHAEVPTSAGAPVAAAGRRRRHRPVSAAARDDQPEERPERRGRRSLGLVHDLARAQRQDRAVRQRQGPPRDELRLPAARRSSRPSTRASPTR